MSSPGLFTLAALLLATASCGGDGSQSSPRACAALSDADISAAVGLTPSSVGGADSGANSTCSWALPNSGNGSVTVVLSSCSGTADCAAALAAAATPKSQWGDVAIGRHGAVNLSAGAPDGILVATEHSLLRIVVTSIDGKPTTVLQALARSAVARVP